MDGICKSFLLCACVFILRLSALGAAPANDMFANRELLQGTNITYLGKVANATSEPGEPSSVYANTVWASWSAPTNGAVTVLLPTGLNGQRFNIYSGSSLETLLPVSVKILNNQYQHCRFPVTAGTVIHFQFFGSGDDFTFALQFYPFGLSPNDSFSAAETVSVYEPRSVVGATMELGEPQHLEGTNGKSLWWKFQASNHGTYYINSSASLVPDVVTAVYKGSAVETLTLVAKGTNEVQFEAVAGETYYFAGAVPTNAVGDLFYYSQYTRIINLYLPVPGNVLQEPSWEGTAIGGAQYWMTSRGLGGYVNEPGGADGTTWPVLPGVSTRPAIGTNPPVTIPAATIWQDFPTIPGHDYRVRFAYGIGGNLTSCCGESRIQYSWDSNVVGTVEILDSVGGWRWQEFVATASNTTSRITFENQARNVEMDAFSVVDLTAPPSIITQPSNTSAPVGGTAAFIVGANGSSPLKYQWFFNGSPLAGQTSNLLVLSPLSLPQSGDYSVRLINTFGSVTSSIAKLKVTALTNLAILVQPYGDVVPVGGFHNLYVVAAGVPTLSYQWYFNDQPLPSATNRNLTFNSVVSTNFGNYQVRVQNDEETVWSLPAFLRVTNSSNGGGTLVAENIFLGPQGLFDAPVFDIDGATRLLGPDFLAQIYAGTSLESMRPAGSPFPFGTGPLAGYFISQYITLPNVPPRGQAVVQVRVWEAAKGMTFEESRAFGGKFGKSATLTLVTGQVPDVPPNLTGLQTFNLQAGLPHFTTGYIEFVERLPENLLVWSHLGEVGYSYLIEKKEAASLWQPFLIITNTASTVTFTNAAIGSTNAVFFRSRILD